MVNQNIIKNLKINKDKNIGNVIVVVEGEEDEFKLLKQIFEKILDYNCVYIKRGNKNKVVYRSKNNKNSVVTIINTKSSNIETVLSDKDYKEQLFSLISDNYNNSLKNVPIYILWDRDRESHSAFLIKKLLKIFGSSRDNDYDMNGLLLLSYPCIEAYELSTFKKRSWMIDFKTSSEAKANIRMQKHDKNYNNHKINENSILLAIGNMNNTLKEFNIFDYDIDNFKSTNLKIFDKEERYYKETKKIKVLSLISIMLFDLGIIEEIDKKQ